MSRALVLNATYEPLCVVPSRRALMLVLAEKAETMETTGHILRSERDEFAEPSVVRLGRFVRVPYPRRRALNRRAVFLRDDHTCQYCGEAFRTDDLIVVWEAVRAGLGIGFVSEHQIRMDPAVIPLLPKLKIQPLPVWLAVHKEVRTSKRIRAVYDFLADPFYGIP